MKRCCPSACSAEGNPSYTEKRVGLLLVLGVISSESGNDIGNDSGNESCGSGPRHAGQPRARGDLHWGGARLTTGHQLTKHLTRAQRVEHDRPPTTARPRSPATIAGHDGTQLAVGDQVHAVGRVAWVHDGGAGLPGARLTQPGQLGQDVAGSLWPRPLKRTRSWLASNASTVAVRRAGHYRTAMYEASVRPRTSVHRPATAHRSRRTLHDPPHHPLRFDRRAGRSLLCSGSAGPVRAHTRAVARQCRGLVPAGALPRSLWPFSPWPMPATRPLPRRLFMSQNDTALFGRDWDVTQGQLTAWSALVGRPAPVLQMRNCPRTGTQVAVTLR